MVGAEIFDGVPGASFRARFHEIFETAFFNTLLSYWRRDYSIARQWADPFPLSHIRRIGRRSYGNNSRFGLA